MRLCLYPQHPIIPQKEKAQTERFIRLRFYMVFTKSG